jgi:hypothetical protein
MRSSSLVPLPDCQFNCPGCGASLKVLGWIIPGMRTLAELSCEQCKRDFYGDLPAGQGLYTPMLIEMGSGTVFDQHGVEWYANWLRDSYADRIQKPIGFHVEKYREIQRPVVLLNCLDRLYGHSLLKLLNAQYHLDRRPDEDLIVMVPRFLAWMVPEGVAQVWIVDLPLAEGIQWNEYLAREVSNRLKEIEVVRLSHAISHPAAEDYAIERFTRVVPFDLSEWGVRLKHAAVTFIWRSDRVWQLPESSGRELFAKKRQADSRTQVEAINTLADELQRFHPNLDFAVAGLNSVGTQPPLPDWIKDLRATSVDETRERSWCERYAMSHVVIGVHGSNMLLPSAHAGSVIELIGEERWNNLTQDLLIRSMSDCRNTLFRYRFMPESTSPAVIAKLVNSILTKQEAFVRLMS